jgi:hypothetical protein
MSGNVSKKISTSNLILYLDAGNSRSYPSAGSTWSDLTVNNNDITLINNPPFSTLNGGCIVFSGSPSSYYGRIPYSSSFNLTGVDFTLECWFRTNSFALGSQVLISKDTQGSNFDWAMEVVNSTTLRIYSNGTTTNVTATVPTMQTGVWYHVVITSTSGTIRIYLNSVLYQTQAMSISNNSQSFVTFGCASWNIPGAFLNGQISVFRFYRRSLSLSEIQENYNFNLNRFIS